MKIDTLSRFDHGKRIEVAAFVDKGWTWRALQMRASIQIGARNRSFRSKSSRHFENLYYSCIAGKKRLSFVAKINFSNFLADPVE